MKIGTHVQFKKETNFYAAYQQRSFAIKKIKNTKVVLSQCNGKEYPELNEVWIDVSLLKIVPKYKKGQRVFIDKTHNPFFTDDPDIIVVRQDGLEVKVRNGHHCCWVDIERIKVPKQPKIPAFLF